MEPVLSSAMCRCCASEGTFKDIHTKYHWMGDEEVYSVMLKECFDITLSSPQGDEGGICEVCITQLRNASNFKKQVLHTEEQFQQMLDNRVQGIKIEYTKDSSEEPEDRPVSDANNSDSDFTPSIKEEEEEALESKPKTKKRIAKSTASRAKKPKVEAPETSTQSVHRIPMTTSLYDKVVRPQSATMLRAKSSNLTKAKIVATALLQKKLSCLNTKMERTSFKNTFKSPLEVDPAKTVEQMRHNSHQILKYTNATPIRRHDGTQYRCAFCNEAYVKPSQLKAHTLETHKHDDKTKFLNERGVTDFKLKLDITLLQCDLCKLECETLEDMIEHLVSVHNVDIHPDVNNQILPMKFTGDNLTCFICQNFCTSFKFLVLHMITHYGNFLCDCCGKAFINTRTLAIHKKSHVVDTFESTAIPRARPSNLTKGKTVANILLKKKLCRLNTEIKRNSFKNTLKSPSKVDPAKTLEQMRHNSHQILKYTNATPIRRHDGTQYVCAFCNEAYAKPSQLKAHTLETHKHDDKTNFLNERGLTEFMVKLDITSLQCDLCKLECETLEDIIEHLVSVHDVNIHSDVNNQILPMKFTGEDLTCFVCHNVCTSFKVLMSHMITHYGNYLCDLCGKAFISIRTLTSHKKSHLVGTFKCKMCEKVFETVANRQQHYHRVHNRCKNYKCGFCYEKFKTYDEKMKHLVAEHNVPSHTFRCNVCDKLFRKATDLTVHTKRDHLMERNCKCTQCGKAFFGLKNLKNHMMRHETQSKFQCGTCSKFFKSKKSLRAHMRIHLDDRRFKCDQCDMSFVHRVSWRSHMKSKHYIIIPVMTN